MTREQLLAATFVDLARSLEDEFDVLHFLQDAVTRAAEMFDGATATLLMSNQRGALQLAASTDPSNDVVHLLESPGPHTESVAGGTALVNVTLSTDGRWPAFADAAARQGFVSLNVIPMHVRTELLGTFTLLFRHPVTLDEEDLTILEAMAGIAKIGLLQDRTPRQQELLAEQLQSALNLRIARRAGQGRGRRALRCRRRRGVPQDQRLRPAQGSASERRRAGHPGGQDQHGITRWRVGVWSSARPRERAGQRSLISRTPLLFSPPRAPGGTTMEGRSERCCTSQEHTVGAG